MKKQVDLSEGEPVVKDPPLHRLFTWANETGGIMGLTWLGTLAFFAGWAITAVLFWIPLSGIVRNTPEEGGCTMIVFGALMALGMLIFTGMILWEWEEDILRKRRAT